MSLKRFLAVLLIVFSFSLLMLPTVYADEDTTENFEDTTMPAQWQEPSYTEPSYADPYTEPTDYIIPTDAVPEETQPTYQGDIYEPPTVPEETQPPTFYPIEEEKPTNPRITSSEDNSGNLIIAIVLWSSIILGIVIVIGIVVATHRRKTM